MARDDDIHAGEGAMESLAAYWDRVLISAPADAVPPRDLDPTLSATIRRLHAVDDAPGADPAFAKRLLEDLMNSMAMTSPSASFGMPALEPAGVTMTDPGRHTRTRRWWALAEIAALVALAVGLSFGALRYYRHQDHDDRAGGIVATALASPSAAVTSASDERAFFGSSGTITVPAADGGSLEIFLGRLTVSPGSEFQLPGEMGYEYAILTGTLMSAPHLYQGATVPWQEDDAGVTVTGEGGLAIRNAADAPATVVLALIGPNAAAWTAPTGVEVGRLAGGEVALPAGYALGDFERTRLLSHQSDEQDTGRDGLVLIAVEAGQLRFHPDAGRLTLFAGGSEATPLPAAGDLRAEGRVVHAGEAVLLDRGAAYLLENDTYEPATFIRLTISPNSALLEPIAPGTGGEDGATAVAEATSAAAAGPLATPDQAECTIAPRTVESMRHLTDNLSGDPNDIIADMFKYGPGAGEPADATTVQAIEATVHEMMTCAALGDIARFFAFCTDRYLASVLLEDEDFAELLAPKPPRPMVELAVWDVRVQVDGRVTARTGDAADHAFMTFVKQGARWLIDNSDQQVDIGTPPGTN